MPGFFDAMERVTVDTVSPDGSVEARLTALDGIRISFREKGVAGHDEDSLAEQVRAVVRGAQRGYGRAANALIAESGLGSPPRDAATSPSQRRRDFDAAVNTVFEMVRSPRGWVRVGMAGDGELLIQIKPGLLTGIGVSEQQLAADITTAVATAMDNYHRSVRRIHRRIYEDEE